MFFHLESVATNVTSPGIQDNNVPSDEMWYEIIYPSRNLNGCKTVATLKFRNGLIIYYRIL